MHDGTLKIESKPGDGTKVTVTIPQARLISDYKTKTQGKDQSKERRATA
jgi:hypothetical protein